MVNMNEFLKKVEHKDKDNVVEFKEVINLNFENIKENLDFENGIIKNISLLSTVSENKRTYSVDVLRECIELAEDVKVFTDHPKEGNELRSVKDLIGKVTEVYLDEEDNILRGNLHIKRSLKEDLFDIAENMPDVVGMSINALGSVVTSDKGYDVVEKIIKIMSIDLVTDPATTKSFFEHIEKEDEENLEDNKEEIKEVEITLEQLRKENPEIFESVRTDILEGIEITTIKENYNKIKESVDNFATQVKELEEKVETLKTENEKLEEEKKETDEKSVKLEEEKKELEVKVDEYELKEALIAKRKEVEDAIKEAELPAIAVSEKFKDMLMKADDMEEVKELISDRKELVEKAKPEIKEEDNDDDENGKTKDLDNLNEDNKNKDDDEKPESQSIVESLLELTEEELGEEI